MVRPFIVAVGLAAIVSCHFHCLAHHAAGAGQLVQALTVAHGQPAPLSGDNPRCEDESSCICGGAVLTASAAPLTIDVTFSQLVAMPVPMLDVGAPFVLVVPAAKFVACDDPFPISGRILRAWFASLTI